MNNKHIIIAHSNEHFLEGIVAQVLSTHYTIDKQFTSGVKALRYILREKPDFAVLESKFSDISTFEIIKEARSKGIDTKFVVIFQTTEYQQFFTARKMKISGCICAGEVLDDLVFCLKSVLEGEVFISNKMKNNTDVDASLEHLSALTNTEMKVLALISIYSKSAKVSEKLDISIRTIEKHRSNIIKKLKLSSDVNSLFRWADVNKKIIHTIAMQNVS